MDDASRLELASIQERLRGVSNPLGLLEGIFAFAPVGLQIYRVDGQSVLVNRAFRALFGSEPPPEYNILRDEIAARGGFLPLIHRAFAGETVRFGPNWYDPRDLEQVRVTEGKRVAIEVTAFPLLDERGKVTHVALVFKDATVEIVAQDMARRESRAREATDILLRIASRLADATTPSEIATVILEHALVALGAQRGLLASTNVVVGDYSLTDEPSTEGARLEEGPRTPLADALSANKPIWLASKAEIEARYPELAKARPTAASIGAVPLSTTGKPLGSLAFEFAHSNPFGEDEQTLVDLLARHAAQALERAELLRQAQEAARRAEEANRAKDEFLGIVSHELRTPLTAIHGWAHLMASSKDDDPSLVARGIDVILRNAKAQVTLIDDILDTARIVVGKLRMTLVATNVAAVARAAIESVSPSAVAKGIALDLVVDGDPVVMADPDRLQQVVWNLLTNAIKFTPDGGKVHVAVELDGRGVLATVRIRDDGIGIAAGDLPFIFDRFRQVDSSTTRAKGGLGLGLAIVRHLIEAHGGQVDATSDGPGKGATFTIELPAVASGTPTSPRGLLRVARTDLAGVDVLVVDDEADAAELVALVLQRRGATTRIAHSANEAMALIDARLPDVVVSDIGMPGEDGFSFLRRLREASGAKKDIPAIALTAYTRAEDAEQSSEAGYGWHLKKPATAEQLVTAVAEAVKR